MIYNVINYASTVDILVSINTGSFYSAAGYFVELPNKDDPSGYSSYELYSIDGKAPEDKIDTEIMGDMTSFFGYVGATYITGLSKNSTCEVQYLDGTKVRSVKLKAQSIVIMLYEDGSNTANWEFVDDGYAILRRDANPEIYSYLEKNPYSCFQGCLISYTG